MRFHTGPFAFLAIFFALMAAPAAAQRCDEFNQSFVNGKDQAQQLLRPFSNELLLKNPDASPCLINILVSMKQHLSGPILGDEDAARVIQITGGLRTVLANSGPAGINAFRASDDLDTIAILTALARGPNQAARINSAAILADVIDNNGLCVVVDHLYDPALGATEEGKTGRVNLISIASVVAPWSYKENYENLQRLIAYLEPALKADPDANRARRLFENLVARVNFQTTIANPPKDQPLPEGNRECYKYTPLFANNDGQRRLIYGN